MKIFLYRCYFLCVALLALLLSIVAVTGGIHAFYYEIDEWLNPDFYQTKTAGPMLHPAELIAALEMKIPEAEVWYLQTSLEAERSAMLAVSPRIDQATGQYFALENNYYYLNPSNAEIIGARNWGECCFEPENLLNFLYELHHSLIIPGTFGSQLMGLVALLWTLTCGIVLYRALAHKKGLTMIGCPSQITAVIAICMLPVALSSLAMNFSKQIFKPVVAIFSPVKPSIYEEYADKTEQDFGERVLSYKAAFDLASQLGPKRGWAKPIGELFYSSSYNFYGMAFGQRDPSGMGNNWLYLSAQNGAVVGEKTPSDGSAGDLFYFSQLPLHSGRGLGIVSQILIFLMGILITLLSIRISVWALKRALSRTAIN